MQPIQRLESRVLLSSQTFTNSTFITIEDDYWPPTAAMPYPSSIDVSGMSGTIVKVTAQLRNFAHDRPQDVDVLLVGPGGAASVILMSDVGMNFTVSGKTFTFDDDYGRMPDLAQLNSGTYRPTNADDYYGNDDFPSPAPYNAPTGTRLNVFNGSSPNGTWSLYVADDSTYGAGWIAGGWSLTITTVDTAPPPPSTPDLDPSSDTGWFDGDEITADNTPTFVGTAAPGSTVHLLADGAEVASGTAGADGAYSITTPALGDGSMDITAAASNSGGTSAPSAALSVRIDTTAPAIASADFLYDADVQGIRYVFTENTGSSFAAEDVGLVNLTTSTAVSGSKMQVAYSSGVPGAGVMFPGFASGVLPDGRYRATIAAGTLSDAAGNTLAADHTLNFFTLAGDANHDAKVDVIDLGILATNWQKPSSARFSEGDFNYDGKVDVIDLGVLATNWQVALPPLPGLGRAGVARAVAGHRG